MRRFPRLRQIEQEVIKWFVDFKIFLIIYPLISSSQPPSQSSQSLIPELTREITDSRCEPKEKKNRSYLPPICPIEQRVPWNSEWKEEEKKKPRKRKREMREKKEKEIKKEEAKPHGGKERKKEGDRSCWQGRDSWLLSHCTCLVP